MQKIKFIFVISLLFSLPITAQVAAPHKTQSMMLDALDAFLKLAPYMHNELKFKDAKNKKVIEEQLLKISTTFKGAKHITEFQSPNFLPSYQIMTEHLDDTLLNFKTGNLSFAQIKLRSTLSLCLSCHTQLPEDKLTAYINSKSLPKAQYFGDALDYADYLYLIRSYDKALIQYASVIKDRLDQAKKIQKLNKGMKTYFDENLKHAFLHSIMIYLKNKRSPKLAQRFLAIYLNDEALPETLLYDIRQWNKQLLPWIKKYPHTIEALNSKNIRSFLDKNASPLMNKQVALTSGDHDIDLIVIAGTLSSFLYRHKKSSLTAEALYWMGVASGATDRNLFFNLGDYYLKQCIKKFPETKIARLCYQTYEDDIVTRNTGTAGENIPATTKKELKKLKDLLKTTEK